MERLCQRLSSSTTHQHAPRPITNKRTQQIQGNRLASTPVRWNIHLVGCLTQKPTRVFLEEDKCTGLALALRLSRVSKICHEALVALEIWWVRGAWREGIANPVDESGRGLEGEGAEVALIELVGLEECGD